MNSRDLAASLLRIARDILSMEFPSQDALDKYLKEHPGADRSLHSVKKTEERDTRHRDVSDKKIKKVEFQHPSVEKVSNLLEKHGLKVDDDELKEIAGYKRNHVGRFGQGRSISAEKLKMEFLQRMDRSNYDSAEAFARAKERIKNMPAKDFERIFAALDIDEEE